MAGNDAELVKRLTIIALVSDDELMEKLVLKGGNAIQFFDGIATPVRRSLDLDFSLDGELGPLDQVLAKVERLLRETFKPEKLKAFDVQLRNAPPNLTEDRLGEFWSGYTLEFKVIVESEFNRLATRPEKRSLQAIEISPGGRRTFSVDISKHERCEGKLRTQLDGFTVFVYSPTMLVCEKIRAICQQMAEYRRVVMSNTQRPRARDFFDIQYVASRCSVQLGGDEVWKQLKAMFEAKRVPLKLLGRISEEREYHRENFASVKDTVSTAFTVDEFDFYVDFLVRGLEPLKARWMEEPPIG